MIVPARRLAASAALVALATTPAAHAASSSTTLAVSANVVDTCAISANPTLAFGNYLSSSMTPLTGSTSISVTCSLGTTYSVSIDGGGSGNVSARRMHKGGDLLTYQLYSDAGMTMVFGDSGLLRVSGVGTGSAVNHTVYGSVPAGQVAAIGAYADSLSVTIDY